MRCAWPEHPEEAAALSRAVVRDCAEHILPRWQAHTDGSDALQQALARAPRTRTRGIRRALEETVRSHPYRTVYAMAVLGMALLEEDPAAGIAACTDHLPLACERPEGAHPWMAARMRHHLARQRPLSLADRRGLARAFAAALDDDDVARAGLLLTGGDDYQSSIEDPAEPPPRFTAIHPRREAFDELLWRESRRTEELMGSVCVCKEKSL